MKVLVTGGAGYIGSHTCVELLQAGHEVVVADDLSNSSEESLRRVQEITGRPLVFCKADLCCEAETEAVFAQNPGIGAVIHFAALKAVGESVQKPLEYYRNNLTCTLVLLDAMRRHGVKSIVYSSSATVYGAPQQVPVQEEFPTSAANPYGATKLFAERILTDCSAADPSLGVALLRYFNPIGAHESGRIGEDPNGIPNNLMPFITQVAVGRLPQLTVFGDDWPTTDGTCVRDYIHVVDLAKGHVAVLDWMAANRGRLVCNLGTGRGTSVLQVVRAFEAASSRAIPYVVGPRRAGDVAELWADPGRIHHLLGWRAKYDIARMCEDSWRWQLQNPNGYGAAGQ